MNVSAQNWHQQRFTAPLKVSGYNRISTSLSLLMANPLSPKKPTNMAYSPQCHLDNHLIVHVDSHSLYQQGHGVYSSLSLSWGKEAATILPIGQLTVHSLPATSHPSLTPLRTDTNSNTIPFIHPHYDNPEEIDYHPNAQIFGLIIIAINTKLLTMLILIINILRLKPYLQMLALRY
ncbi:hypothetical protein J4731_25745 [Providencia rettgeri]|nr:hypothetical protein [Providencia rettgeri]